MTTPTTHDAIREARERLVHRARREGLVTVGYAVLDSPVGPLWVAMGPKGVAAITYDDEPAGGDLARLVKVHGPGLVPDRRRVDPLARELDAYFMGRKRRFATPVDLSGLTAFQQRVLRALTKIPFGDLTTYGALARAAGRAAASRATGGVVGSNPIPIVVPCHRVVASDGTLGGYSGGLDVKRRLLALERGDVPEGGWPSRRAGMRGLRDA
jgi:methylated-DNA-[protein]-cysteine S-methyltransferase